ncbi:PEP-CTERM sorting domain-containing protein [Akkermansiaceae bacterium]|nr:PEP-CTERM sorting domain-containing protein [Akkermansiaceae bacterium]
MKNILKTVPLCLSALVAPSAYGVVVFDDSFADGGFTNGTDATDTAWHGTTGNSAIEIFAGDLSLRSGTSGRGLHAEFSTQVLSTIGDKITATFNFTTPATIGTNKGGAFRIGLFNSNGETVHTEDGLSSSDARWDNVIGNMVDLDVATAGSENFQFREKGVTAGNSKLLGTTSGFVSQGSGGEDTNYVFAINTSYIGTYSIEQTGASEWMISSSLDDGVTNDFETRTVTSLNTSSYDILAFHVNSETFGSTNAGGEADNGIDFQSVSVEFEGVPEPSSALLSLLGGMMAFRRRRA